MRKPVGIAILLWNLCPTQPATSATTRDLPGCGTEPTRGPLVLARHREFERRRGPFELLTAAEGETAGNFALVEADASILVEENAFDLRAVSIAFVPLDGEASRYRQQRDGSSVEPGLGQSLSLGDDDGRAVELGFEFPFFGRRARQLFVNSDGNLTFGVRDTASTQRSLARFLAGAPRVALFFNDLNPETGGQIRVANFPDRLVVTWDAVPEFSANNRNTFQVVLEPSGRIVFRFDQQVDARSAVVGISAGGAPAEVNLVDLSGESFEGSGALAERFSPTRSLDDVAAARKFYRSFPDAFDQVLLWTNFDFDLEDAFAYEVDVRNNIEGIGLPVFDDSALWGSAGRLQSFVQMGNLKRYPENPELRVGRLTTLGLLAHESGHRWLATVRFINAEGIRSDDLLGRQRSHWSFFFDTDGSFLEGNDIEELTTGSFRTRATLPRYFNLDLYLMGFAPPAEVGPMFYVANAPGDREAPPEVNVPITGQKRDVTLADIIRAEGPRRPEFQTSQKEWRQAWVIVYRPENPPTAEEIARVEAARAAWEPFFKEQTLGRGTVITSLPR